MKDMLLVCGYVLIEASCKIIKMVLNGDEIDKQIQVLCLLYHFPVEEVQPMHFAAKPLLMECI